ncbi:helix-turn-helix domain-containing protein, partial [Treponema sp. R80B11-R83G3]
ASDMWEDNNEFYRGLRIVREGGQYISPKVQEMIDHFDEYPDANGKVTKKERECLVMLCSGFTIEQIMEELDIAKSTVYNHLNSLYKTFHVHNREEMIALAWETLLTAF